LPELSFDSSGLGNNQDGSVSIVTDEAIAEYLLIVQSFESQFAQSSVTQDIAMFYALVNGWDQILIKIEDQLKVSELQTNAGSLLNLKKEIDKVKAAIDGYFDSHKFKKSGPIPIEIRELVDGTIKENFGEKKSTQLTMALNQWKAPLTEDQKNILSVVKAIAETSSELKNAGLDCEDCEELKDDEGETPKKLLNIVLDQTIQVAKFGIKVGIALSPIQKFIDFCEVVTGKESCLPGGHELTPTDRAFTAVGMFVGSSLFWKQIAKASKIFSATKVGVLASTIYEKSVRVIKQKTPGAIKYFINLVQRIFGKSPEKIEKLEQEIGGLMKRYGPMEAGPLHVLREGEGFVADTFRSGSYFETTLTEEVKLYRVYSDEKNVLGRYWSRVKPNGPLQATLDSALDPNFGNRATKWVEIKIPAGEIIYEGTVSDIYLKSKGSKVKVGSLLGGGTQVYITTKLHDSWEINKGVF
jgi:hypothetical protein